MSPALSPSVPEHPRPCAVAACSREMETQTAGRGQRVGTWPAAGDTGSSWGHAQQLGTRPAAQGHGPWGNTAVPAVVTSTSRSQARVPRPVPGAVNLRVPQAGGHGIFPPALPVLATAFMTLVAFVHPCDELDPRGARVGNALDVSTPWKRLLSSGGLLASRPGLPVAGSCREPGGAPLPQQLGFMHNKAGFS